MASPIEMRIAVIGATAALLGTLAGGAITYWQTRDLQTRQFARDDHVRAVAAGAAAAVEAGRYDIAQQAAREMLASHYYADVSPQLKPQLSVADVQSMVAALSPSARAMRNEAELCIEHLASTVRGHAVGRDRIPRELEPALKADGACTAAGAKALGPLAARVREG